MPDPSELKILAKKWMLFQLRERLRAAVINERLDAWVQNPQIAAPIRFEFVLDGKVLWALTDGDKKTVVSAEQL